MQLSLITMTTAVALIAGAVSAQANCGDAFLGKGQHFIKMPIPPLSKTTDPGPTIVGMWRVQYSSQGNELFQSLQQWHSDGTEFEFADIPTITGDICMGVYSVQGNQVSLYHTAWTFDSSGNPYGTMVLTHQDKVAPDGNTFKGKFDLKFYDGQGNLVNKITGKLDGTRISAP